MKSLSESPQPLVRPAIRIAVVFATMNRPEAALGCVRALARQTRIPDLVVVALNAPGDGTREALLAMRPLPFRIELHEMPANGGNAGGVEAAVRVAGGIGFEALWVLDDDSWPRPEALEVLENGLGKGGKVASIPLQVDPVSMDIAWPLVLLDEAGNSFLVRKLANLPKGNEWISRPSWTGTLYPEQALIDAGPIKGELFIRGEDEEYSFRVAEAGWSFLLCRDAVLDHAGPKNMIYRRILGKNFFWEPDLPGWKLYYKVRNMVWMKKRGGWGAGAGAVVQCCYGCLMHDRMSVGRWKVFLRALSDGWAGRLGRVEADWAP